MHNHDLLQPYFLIFRLHVSIFVVLKSSASQTANPRTTLRDLLAPHYQDLLPKSDTEPCAVESFYRRFAFDLYELYDV